MHIVLKYNDDLYDIDTVKEHNNILDEKKEVIWGIIKPSIDSPGMGSNKKNKLRSQIENNIGTYAFLATSGNITHKCEISGILEKEEVENERELVPEYYRKDIETCVAGIKLKSINNVDSRILESLQRYGGGEVALGNQTNPLYVQFGYKDNYTVNENESNKYLEQQYISLKPNQMIEHIYNYINSKGFIFLKEDISNLYLSMKTKPFIILAGISGTGKSKIVELFANAIGANNENGRFRLISVKPDWNDSSELFGYININEEFVPGILSKICYEANKIENINKPYFICLDEMNLARVEYYLSDYLSIIETRYQDDKLIKTNKIFPIGYFKTNNKYQDIYFSDNIIICGTVNMDDTTFAFSEKVLDRANTIEFSSVILDFLDFEEFDINSKNIKNDNFKTSYLTIKDAVLEDKISVKNINTKIIEIHNIFKNYNRPFGYRVRDEIIFYMLENNKYKVIDYEKAFDYQILQKILPRISGNEYEIKLMLIDLFNYLNKNNEVIESSNYLDSINMNNLKFEKSSRKIIEMLRSYENGYVSFW